MNLTEFAKSICFGDRIEDKLTTYDSMTWDEPFQSIKLKEPARSGKIQFSLKKAKFPKDFQDEKKKAMALHSFANHELLAIEMMAAALLLFPHDNQEQLQFKKGVLSTLLDEQKHFRLYCSRLNDWGFDFGDFPLNNYFWSFMEKVKTPSQFLSMMGLTFEGANLDFARYYQYLFEELGDFKTAKILEIVYQDEIKHVAFARTKLNAWRKSKSLWEYYLEQLPWPLTPARSKGILFYPEAREQAGLDQDFISKLQNYSDGYAITERKKWKQT